MDDSPHQLSFALARDLLDCTIDSLDFCAKEVKRSELLMAFSEVKPGRLPDFAGIADRLRATTPHDQWESRPESPLYSVRLAVTDIPSIQAALRTVQLLQLLPTEMSPDLPRPNPQTFTHVLAMFEFFNESRPRDPQILSEVTRCPN